MVIACEEFERSLGHNPRLIVDAMGWHPERSAFATTRLTELAEQLKRLRQEHQYAVQSPSGWRDRACLLGCAVVSLAIIFVFIMGITSIVHMF
jgi:hypothetical protein